MVKFLLLSMTLILITASAALIGLDEIPINVIEIKGGVLKEEESSSSSFEEPPKTLDEKEPPRFIPDEEITADPSAIENQKENEGKPSPKIPTEREIKKKASPYVLEIINIKDNAFANLASLEKKIAIDYLSFPKEERGEAPGKLKDKYMPQINLLLSTCDKDVDRVLGKLKAALSSINAPLDMVEEAKQSYLDEKNEIITSYEELLKSLGQDIDISALLENN